MPNGNRLPPEEYQRFVDWLIRTYGGTTPLKPVWWHPNTAGIKEDPYYQYYATYVMVAPATGEPVITPRPISEVLPHVPAGEVFYQLPSAITLSDGTDVDVNWTSLGVFREEDDPLEREIEVFAPVLPPEMLNTYSMKDVYKNIYGVMEDGVIWMGAPLSPEDLSNAGATPESLFKTVAYPSMLQGVSAKRGEKGLTSDMEEFLQYHADKMLGGAVTDMDFILKELDKMEQFPEYANVLRATGRMPAEKLPPWWYAADRQRALAFQQGFGTGRVETEEEMAFRLGRPLTEAELGEKRLAGLTPEQQRLTRQIQSLRPIVEEFKPKFEAGIYDEKIIAGLMPQFAMAAIKTTEEAQRQLAAFQPASGRGGRGKETSEAGEGSEPTFGPERLTERQITERERKRKI
mgnify:CR=1 FL=1